MNPIDVWMTYEQAKEEFGIAIPTLRKWKKEGRIHPEPKPRRKGQGRGRVPLLVRRGEILALMTAVCPVTGETFIKKNLRQVYIDDAARKRAHWLNNRSKE